MSKKNCALSLRKVKSQKVRWTTAWRRKNKKVKTDEHGKKVRRRKVHIQRAIVGIDLEEITKKR